jgi:hypothetical protein
MPTRNSLFLISLGTPTITLTLPFCIHWRTERGSGTPHMYQDRANLHQFTPSTPSFKVL